jgi:4-amino-4-deoxy-L-arabinose transferase-like glycosyltransferase
MAAADRATLADNLSLGAAKRRLFASPDWAVAALVVFGATLAWATCVRLPILSSEGMDEAFYAEVAHLWTRGVLPYAGAFDVKPPGYFALLALSQSLFGASLGSLRAISVVSDATTAAALFFIGCAMGSRTLGAFAALVSPPLSALVTNNDCYPVLAAFTTLAFLPVFHASAIMKRAATAGLIIGAACTIKQTAAFEALGLLAIFLRSTEAAGGRARVALAFCLSAAVAPLGFLIYFAAQGAAGPLIADTVFSALQRPALDQGFFTGLMLFAPVQRVIAPTVVVAFLALLRRRAIEESAPDSRIAAVAIWLACATCGVLAQHMVYQNYLGPMLSPLILLAGAGARWGLPEFARAAPALRLAVIGLATVSTALYWRIGHFARPIDAAPIAEASRMILASGPRSTDKLLAIDFGGWSNVETDLAPPTPFFHRMHLLCSFPAAGPSRLAEALAARPRYVIVGEYLNAHSRCDGPDAWPLVKPALDASYRLLGHVAGKVQSFDIYRADPSR